MKILRNCLKKEIIPLIFQNLIFTHTAEESKAINSMEGSSIIISASGMCEAGRINTISSIISGAKNQVL
jgi:metallo-beta-lactamase family protein